MLQKTGYILILVALVWLGAISVLQAADSENNEKNASAEEKTTAEDDNKETKKEEKMTDSKLEPGTYAIFETSLGNFTVKLYTEKTPETAQNFIDLTQGKKEYADPETGKMTKGRLYDGRKIFRVIKGFMFQTGSPNDTNRYNPGFTIKDEIRDDLKFDRPGLLAMANIGRPNTSGCQFFVTLAPAEYLNGGYTIFGEVVDGMDTVNKIGDVPVKMGGEATPSLPVDMPVIKKVEIKKVD